MIDRKSNLFHDITIRLARLLNIALMVVPFVFVWYSQYADLLWVHFVRRGHWLVIGLYIFLYFLIGKIYDAFKMSYFTKGEMVYNQLLSLFEVNVVMYIVAWILIRHAPNPLPMLLMFAVQAVIAVIWAVISQKWYFMTFPPNKTVVVWDTRQGITKLIEKYNLDKKFKVVKSVTAEECIADMSVLDETDTVFLIGVHSHDRNIIAKHCLMNNVEAYLIPRIGDLIIASATRSNLFHLLLLKV